MKIQGIVGLNKATILCESSPVSSNLQVLRIMRMIIHHCHYTLLLPTKVRGVRRQAAGKGCQNPTPCSTRQIQARPNQPWALCSPPAGAQVHDVVLIKVQGLKM